MGGGSITGSGKITNNGTTAYNFYSGLVSANLDSVGPSGLTKSAGTASSAMGILTLAGHNTYTGNTTLSGGTVILGSDMPFGTSTLVYSGTNNTTIMYASDLSGQNADISARFASSGTVTRTLLIAPNGNTVHFNTPIADLGKTGLTVNGGQGVLVLGAPSTYLGDTIVSGDATIRYGVSDAIATGNINVNGGILDLDSYSETNAGTVTLGSSPNTTSFVAGTITAAAGAGSLTSLVAYDLNAGLINVPLGGASSVTLTKHGIGTVVFASDHSTFQGAIVFSQSGGTIQIGDGTTGSIPSTRISTAANLTGPASLVFNHNYDDIAYAGTITGAVGVTQSGAGMLTLSGPNSYQGGTNLNAGILAIGSASGIGSGIISFNGGALRLFDTFDYSPMFSSAANQAMNVDIYGQSVVFHAPITSAGGTLNLSDSSGIGGAVTLFNNGNTYDQTIIPYGVAVNIGAGGTLGLTGNFGLGTVHNDGTINFNRTNAVTVSNNIVGSGAVNQIESGTTILTGANTWSGPTTISKGTLQIGNGGAAGSLGTAASVTDNGTLAYNKSGVNTFSTAVTGTGGFKQMGPGTTTLTNYSATGALSITGGRLVLGTGTIRANSLTITAGTGSTYLGTLDVSSHRFVVDTTGGANKTAALTAIRAEITSGKGTGNWLGTGITSSTIVADKAAGNNSTTIAVADNANVKKTVFGNATVNNNSLLVQRAIIGDGNLDGVTNSADYTLLVANFKKTGANWGMGDYNQDGVVNSLDYTALVANFKKTLSGEANLQPDTASVPSVGVGAIGGGTGAVPEPTSLALLGLGAAALLTRRRRRQI
jgi:autotransporter-associated beta strand protein